MALFIPLSANHSASLCCAQQPVTYNSLHGRWWKEYSDRKNDEEDEHVADSLLYDRSHLPRAAPPPESVFQERERARQTVAVEFTQSKKQGD